MICSLLDLWMSNHRYEGYNSKFHENVQLFRGLASLTQATFKGQLYFYSRYTYLSTIQERSEAREEKYQMYLKRDFSVDWSLHRQ